MPGHHIHHTVHHSRKQSFWLKEESVLAAVAAVLAFVALYAYTGNAGFYYSVAGALGMGGMIYAGLWMAPHRKL